MKTLEELFAIHGTPPLVPGGDKGNVHSYIPTYSKILEPYRMTDSNVLEIGVRYGSSMRMWEDYFPNAIIHGVDVLPECMAYASDRTNIYIIDATSPQLLEMLGDITFDVIIDDGSHRLEHQVASFNLLFPRLNEGGLYVIEDILDFERDMDAYMGLHPSLQVADLRDVKNRGDDMLLIYRK